MASVGKRTVWKIMENGDGVKNKLRVVVDRIAVATGSI
jgi:hypothetical protein